METEDLRIGGEFSFFKKNFKFSGKRIFDTADGKLTTNTNYNLTIEPSPLSLTTISHVDSELSCEGEYTVWQSDDKEHSVGIYKKSTVDNFFNLNTTSHLLYSFGRNLFFNFGFRNLGIFGTKSENVNFCTVTAPYLSIGGMYKFLNEANMTSWTGMHVDFTKDGMEEAKTFVGINSAQFNTVFSISVLRNVIQSDSKQSKLEKTTVDPVAHTVTTQTTEKSVVKETVSYPLKAAIGVASKISDEFELFSLINSTYEGSAMKTDLMVGGVYTFDPETNYRFKFKDDYSLSLALQRRFRNFVDISFVTNFKYLGAKLDLGTSVQTKFGMALNFMDDI